jgi:hypothetical protein
MSDFFDSAKRTIGEAVSRAGWEAEKRLRVNAKQAEIDALYEQQDKTTVELRTAALNLYRRNALSEPELVRICRQLEELARDVDARNAQLTSIKAESYQEVRFSAPSPTPTPPPAGASASKRADDDSQVIRCPTCASPVRAQALYCRHCGAKLR